MKSLLTFLAAIILIGTLNAQSNCACCSTSHQQFDFWIGDWVVKDSKGTIVGENQISKIQDNCILKEQWTGSSGTTGTSSNYFNPKDNTWNQLWLDNQGTILKLKGQFNAGKMKLKSEPFKGKDSLQLYHQITWTKNSDKTVSQLWEVYDEKHQVVNTLFLGIYHRKE